MAKGTRKYNDLRLASIAFIGVIALIASVVISATSSRVTSFASTQKTAFTTDQWNAALGQVIHSDVTQSVTLPSGKILWIFGDTVQVNGTSTSGAYGYPHDAFVTQLPNSLSFTAVTGNYGYGWQQVPNWSDGTYFWFVTPIVDNGVLYVLGQRIQGVNPFTVVGDYVAVFNAKTLAFQKIVQVPGGSTGITTWGGAAKTSTGWWITGSHNVSCSNATDCKVGDMAFVPFGKIATSTSWKVYNNVIPATTNIGTTLGLLQNGFTWDIFTKVGDAYGGTQIERLTASSPTGTWTVNGTWDAPSPSGTVTYGVAVHPEQTSPSGQVLVSYDVNGNDPDTHPLFEYLPK
ncbi:MAG TPA: hypothetical protein VLF93_06520 [Candidatus Saccharimonadales bacterium]|nr:hypothetical protein [Candidatus Saccharimonadales bacterium]